MRSVWFACPSLLTKSWLSKILPYLEGRFQKVLQLQFFSVLILSLIYIFITSCPNGKMRVWLGWPTGLWPGSYGTGRGEPLFGDLFAIPYPVSMISWKSHETHCSFFSQTDTFKTKIQKSFWGISYRTNALYLCISDWVLPKISVNNTGGKCPLTDEWIKKMWCIYNGILLSHKKE